MCVCYGELDECVCVRVYVCYGELDECVCVWEREDNPVFSLSIVWMLARRKTPNPLRPSEFSALVEDNFTSR